VITLTNLQARQFLLLKHGLIGEYRFIGKEGAFDFVKQSGCIQFDPVDVCGKNAELVLQSRVKNFTKRTLEELLYKDRLLLDYPDKNLSIIPSEEWPYFTRFKEAARRNVSRYPEMRALLDTVYQKVLKDGAVCSDDLGLKGDFYWQSAIHWSAGHNLSRSVLEQLYSTGDLIIHHKNGSRKYYDAAEKYFPSDLLHAPEPLPDDFEFLKWRILRRIGAVGMLWDRPSDAWLNIWNLTAGERSRAFTALLAEGKLLELTVEGIKSPLYCRCEDISIINTVLQNPELKPRCEFIAPLDNFLWDRKLVKTIFGFYYSWEIYTPPEKRKYGHYVLPIIYGSRFIGRIEAVCDRKNKCLAVNRFWPEDGVKMTKALTNTVNARLARFAKFNEMSNYDQLSVS